MLTTILKSFDKTVIVAITLSYFSLFLLGVGLILIPISSSIACGLTISFKILYEIIMQKCNQYKKQCEKCQQTINISINYIVKVYKIT